jgi:hypothetical protein
MEEGEKGKKIEYNSLEEEIYGEFKKIIERLNLNGAKINSFYVKCEPKPKYFGIMISSIKLPYKKFTLEKVFASRLDGRLDPEIREFREKYNINYIGCNIKGIEYLNKNNE